MWKKNDDFSQSGLAKFMASKEAAALAAMLQQMDTSALSQAASYAAQGKTDQAKALLEPLTQDPKIRQLLEQMEGHHG